jgi:uncharacterized peroxidase-related enzyme
MTYPIHSVDSAPAGSRETLEGARRAFGFVPNVLGTMASSPSLLKTYLVVGDLFDQTSLSPTERQVVMMTTSYENGCEYCVGAHTAISGMQKVPADVVQAIRDGARIADAKLEALRRFTSAVVCARGWVTNDDRDAFHRAGYSETQALEVILGVGLKTFANYANHLAETPLDAAFSKVAWTKGR